MNRRNQSPRPTSTPICATYAHQQYHAANQSIELVSRNQTKPATPKTKPAKPQTNPEQRDKDAIRCQLPALPILRTQVG